VTGYVDGDDNITPTEFVVCFVFEAVNKNITRREGKERGREKEREGRREKRKGKRGEKFEHCSNTTISTSEK
jgi:hypothetical protein